MKLYDHPLFFFLFWDQDYICLNGRNIECMALLQCSSYFQSFQNVLLNYFYYFFFCFFFVKFIISIYQEKKILPFQVQTSAGNNPEDDYNIRSNCPRRICPIPGVTSNDAHPPIPFALRGRANVIGIWPSPLAWSWGVSKLKLDLGIGILLLSAVAFGRRRSKRLKDVCLDVYPGCDVVDMDLEAKRFVFLGRKFMYGIN